MHNKFIIKILILIKNFIKNNNTGLKKQKQKNHFILYTLKMIYIFIINIPRLPSYKSKI